MNNATIGFEGLAAEINKPSKSLHRMLAPRGNPNTENFFGIVRALQKKTRVKLRVTAKAAWLAAYPMAQIGVSETEALERGMEEKAVEFRQAGAEVYRKLWTKSNSAFESMEAEPERSLPPYEIELYRLCHNQIG